MITNFEQKLIVCIHVQWLLLYQYINHITVIYNLTFIPLIFPFISIHSKFIVDVHPINKIIFSIHFVITALMYVSNKQLLSVLNVKNFLYHLKGHKKSCFIILMLKIKNIGNIEISCCVYRYLYSYYYTVSILLKFILFRAKENEIKKYFQKLQKIFKKLYLSIQI